MAAGAIAAGTVAALDHWLALTQASTRQPSLSAAIARGGEVVWHGGVGAIGGRPDGQDGADSAAPGVDTAYRIASVTKTFVAVAILQLLEQGRLHLGDQIARWLPDAPCPDATIAQLLSHTSGLQAETDGDWWERSPGYTWQQLLAQGMTRRFAAGRKYHYSNVGYAVLGRLLEVAHGAPWDVVLERQLLRPLGMARTGRLRPQQDSATGWAVHPHAALLHAEPVQDYRALGPAGELWSTCRDLSIWGSFLAGAIDGPLGRELLAQMREPWCVNDLPGLGWVSGHGLGLQVWNTPIGGPTGPAGPVALPSRRYAGHTGSVPGFTCELRFDPDAGDVAVTLGSATSGFGGGAGLLTAYQEREPAPVPPWRPDPTHPDRIALVGTWYWGSMPYVVSAAADGGLEVVMAAGARSAVFLPDGALRWIGQSGYFAGEPLTAAMNPDGSVRWLDVASFRLSRTPYDPDAALPGGPDPRGWH